MAVPQADYKNVKIKPDIHAQLKIQAVKEGGALFEIVEKACNRYLEKPDKPERK